MKATTTTEDGAIHQGGSLPRGNSDPGDLLPLSKVATTREGDTTFHWRLIRRGETEKGGTAERGREDTEKDLDADIERLQRYIFCVK